MDLSFMCKTQITQIPFRSTFFGFVKEFRPTPTWINCLFFQAEVFGLSCAMLVVIHVNTCGAYCVEPHDSIQHGMKWLSEASKKHKSHMLDFTFIRISNHTKKENQKPMYELEQFPKKVHTSDVCMVNVTVFASQSKHIHITHTHILRIRGSQFFLL